MDRFFARPRAVDFDRDQVRCAFAVGGDRLGEIFADFEQRGAKGIQSAFL